MNMKLSTDLDENIAKAKEIFPIGVTYDIIVTEVTVGTTRTYFLGINGFCQNSLALKLFTTLEDPTFTKDSTIEDLQHFINSKVGCDAPPVSPFRNKRQE